MEKWEKGQFKRTSKELSRFDNKDNKKPEELKLEFDHFDLDNSYPSSPSKAVTSWS